MYIEGKYGKKPTDGMISSRKIGKKDPRKKRERSNFLIPHIQTWVVNIVRRMINKENR
jgi:hypothetical protein